jgi:dihydrofolate synthase/folylpolyglutamate synthase
LKNRVDVLIDRLSEIHPKGFDLSLDRISALLEKLGNPQDRLPPVIHVAGTNGKGSTIAFARAILEAQGFSVHVHTSPHLVNWRERYRLAGDLVGDDLLADAIERVADANDNQPITVFELLSAVMFVLFSEHAADFALVEVGLGGRFDATNVIARPIACAISPVALDHQAYLGDTIEKIAFEKAGIIKQGVPVAVGLQADGARDVIEQVAARNKSPVFIARQDYDFYQDATGFVYQDNQGLLDLPMPRLLGEHQLANAALAIATTRLAGIAVTDRAFQTAMKTVSWPGRFEKLPSGNIGSKLPEGTEIWIDGGHNPSAGEAISALLAGLDRGTGRRTILVCGMINTKDPTGYLMSFSGLDILVLTVPVSMSEAGIEPELLKGIAEKAGLEARACNTLEEAIGLIARELDISPQSRIVFCGSLYLVGEVLDRNGTPPQ